MKRTPLLRRAELRRTTRLKVVSSPAPRRPRTEAEIAWKAPRWGRCENCGQIDVLPLHGHHVLERQLLRRAGLPEFDPRNRMDLCDRCHGDHHYGLANRKILVEKLPDAALAFAVDVLGEHRAAEYIGRRYGRGDA